MNISRRIVGIVGSATLGAVALIGAVAPAAQAAACPSPTTTFDLATGYTVVVFDQAPAGTSCTWDVPTATPNITALQVIAIGGGGGGGGGAASGSAFGQGGGGGAGEVTELVGGSAVTVVPGETITINVGAGGGGGANQGNGTAGSATTVSFATASTITAAGGGGGGFGGVYGQGAGGTSGNGIAGNTTSNCLNGLMGNGNGGSGATGAGGTGLCGTSSNYITTDQTGIANARPTAGHYTIGSRQGLWVNPNPPGPAPGPSGGGSSAEATPSPTPTPTPTTAPADPLTPGSLGGGTGSQLLSAGASLLLVDGKPAAVTVTPNQKTVAKATGLTISGPGFTMRLAGRGDQSDPLGLTSKQALVLQSEPVATRSGVVGRMLPLAKRKVQPVAQSSGDGFKADSEVKFFILADTYLGTLPTDASGAYEGSLPIPAGIKPGVYTLQVNGFAPSGEVRSLSIGVQVVAANTARATRKAQAEVFFAPMSATITDHGKATLDKLVTKTGRNGVKTTVIGYVQPIGGTANDAWLSRQRAQAVAQYLRGKGLKGAYVVRGNGRASQTGAEARRVEVTVAYRK